MNSRLILNGALSSAEGLAIDETICESAAQGVAPPTLHLYHYKPCVIIGRYQNAAASLRLDRCEMRGIEVNRRITGGGTVFMTPDQMAFGLALPSNFPSLPKSIQGSFEFLAAIFARALSEFGLQAEFMGKNDLAVGGKKIAGLAISQDMDGVTFFHSSLLLDFDIETMLDILNLPTQRMLDRGISCFGDRMTTIRRELPKRGIALSQLQEAVARALRLSLGMDFLQGDLTEREKERMAHLRRERYDNDEWIYRTRAPKRRMASAERKTPGGLLQVHLCAAGGAIECILVTGDYFSRTRDIARLESLLKWTSLDRASLEGRLAESGDDRFIHQVDLPVILDLIQDAAKNANGLADL